MRDTKHGMDDSRSSHGSDQPLLVAIALVLFLYILYILAAKAGWLPSEAAHSEDPGHEARVERPAAAEAAQHEAEAPEHEIGVAEEGHPPPPLWMVIPFLLLLGAIAVLPLIPATEHWWESNRNRFIVAAVLGAITLLYYILFHEYPVAGHWIEEHLVPHSEGGLNLHLGWAVFANAILHEYIPFIMLLFSLYTISGGIRIQGDLPAHPLTNSAFITVGGLLASFIGTTGAAMLLIRPLLETNSERKHVKHTVIFFIFVVCNCGGCLLPIGDPPLFLGYLRGVGFLWTFKLWPQWLFVNTMLIGMYYLYDHYWYYPHERAIDVARDERLVRRLKFSGLWPNVPLLLGVILSVALLDPSKELFNTGWRPWPYLREITQLGLVALSLILGSRAARRANNFNYHAILEVAALFFGIFICMQPPLQILHVWGPELGLSEPMQFFWLTGGLSAVLDNAPTYVVFFETASTLPLKPNAVAEAGVAEALLKAISLGAVFMGAMTYIGNGPNFMVKAIAEKSGIPMPSFFGYMLYSCCVLLPLLALTTCITWIVLPAIAQ
jgi:Na+/H+ antiporter NhaD/arsenite permease-like protein